MSQIKYEIEGGTIKVSTIEKFMGGACAMEFRQYNGLDLHGELLGLDLLNLGHLMVNIVEKYITEDI